MNNIIVSPKKSLKFKTISSGSEGNAYILNDNLAIELGTKAVIDDIEKIKPDNLFISHKHGDHLNLPCFNALKKAENLPKNIYCTKQVFDEITKQKRNTPEALEDLGIKFHFLEHKKSFTVWTFEGTLLCTPFKAPHTPSVDCLGLSIVNLDTNETMIFGTDLSTTEYAEEPFFPTTFDIIAMEGNYDMNTMDELLNLTTENLNNIDLYLKGEISNLPISASVSVLTSFLKPNEDLETMNAIELQKVMQRISGRIVSNLRHLSIQSFDEFVKKHSKSDTRVLMLHESAQFGTSYRLLNGMKVE